MIFNLTVIYDACVLYSAPLRDLLMQLALTDLFAARWSDEIHDEWIRNVLKNRPNLTIEQLINTKNLMNKCVLDCLVTDYELIIPSLNLPDPNDRHILAAAIKAGASIIVTLNLKDFPSLILAQYEMEAQHPDNFILDLIEIDCQAVLVAIETCRQRLKKPPKSVDEYLEILRNQGLENTVLRLQEMLWALG